MYEHIIRKMVTVVLLVQKTTTPIKFHYATNHMHSRWIWVTVTAHISVQEYGSGAFFTLCPSPLTSCKLWVYQLLYFFHPTAEESVFVMGINAMVSTQHEHIDYEASFLSPPVSPTICQRTTLFHERLSGTKLPFPFLQRVSCASVTNDLVITCLSSLTIGACKSMLTVLCVYV